MKPPDMVILRERGEREDLLLVVAESRSSRRFAPEDDNKGTT